jgi:hypothetical protein
MTGVRETGDYYIRGQARGISEVRGQRTKGRIMLKYSDVVVILRYNFRK